MKPKPLASLNHLTLPVAICVLLQAFVFTPTTTRRRRRAKNRDTRGPVKHRMTGPPFHSMRIVGQGHVRPDMKACVITLLALGVAGCRAAPLAERHAPPTGFPIGTYTNCARGTRNPSGNSFVNVAGFESGAVLTLAQSGTTVHSTFVDQNGVTASLSFSTTTGTSATLTEPGQVIPCFSSLCVLGPRNQQAFPARMTTRAGTLIYNAGMVFITLTGSLQSDA